MIRSVIRCLAAASLVTATLVIPSAPAAAAAVSYQRYIFPIQAGHTGKVMTILGNSTAHGAAAVQFGYTQENVSPSNDVMVQEVEPGDWVRIKPMSNYHFNPQDPHNDMCLAVRGASPDKGAAVIQAKCTYDDVNNDVWKRGEWSSGSTGWWYFKNARSNLCLVVQYAGRDDRTPLIQHDCNGTDNGRWAYKYAPEYPSYAR